MNMFSMIRAFLALLFVVSFINPVFAGDTPILLEQVTLTSANPSLARYWSHHDAAYKKAHPWKEVWEMNCARTGIPCTAEAWRTQVQPGTVVYLPAPTIVVLAPTLGVTPEAIALVPSATPGVLEVAPSAPVVIAEQVNTRKQLQSAMGNVSVLEKSVKQSEGLITFLGMLLFASVIGLVVVTRRRKVAGDDVLCMRNRINDLEEDIATVTRERDRLRRPVFTVTPPCEVLHIPRDVEPSIVPAGDSPIAVRSIEVTFQEDEFGVAAFDAKGVRYTLDGYTAGAPHLKNGDKFYADVSADNRVVTVLTNVGGTPSMQDTA